MKQREGIPVCDGVFRVVQGMRLAPPENRKRQRRIVKAVRLFFLFGVMLAPALVFAAESAAAKPTEIRCEGEYPLHLQGVATDGTSIYWTFTTVLVKTDLTGKVQAKHEIARKEGHMGDLCCRDGKVYVGMNLGYIKGCRVGDEVWEYDARELKLLKKYPTPEAVWCNNGLEYHAGCFWVISSAQHHSRYNMVFRYTPDFKFMRCQMIDSGWTHLGVQTICLWNDKMLFGCYGNQTDEKFPHKSCTFSVDGKELAFDRVFSEFPPIVSCERREDICTAEGMLVLDGKLMSAHGILLSPKEDKKHQRWSARLRPLKL